MSISTAIAEAPGALKPLTVSVKDARAILGLGNTKIYELIGAGEIRTIKVGVKTLVVYASLEQFVANRSEAA